MLRCLGNRALKLRCPQKTPGSDTAGSGSFRFFVLRRFRCFFVPVSQPVIDSDCLPEIGRQNLFRFVSDRIEALPHTDQQFSEPLKINPAYRWAGKRKKTRIFGLHMLPKRMTVFPEARPDFDFSDEVD